MKLLKTITHPDFPIPKIRIQKRESVRIVLIDHERKIPVIHATKFDHYKIPGWWIDKWEDTTEALKREALEEAWCEIEISGEVWTIHEKRVWGQGESLYNLDQVSYCYYGKALDIHDPGFTDFEKERGFWTQWLTYEEAIREFQSCNPKSDAAKIMHARDLLFLEEWYKLIKKEA